MVRRRTDSNALPAGLTGSGNFGLRLTAIHSAHAVHERGARDFGRHSRRLEKETVDFLPNFDQTREANRWFMVRALPICSSWGERHRLSGMAKNNSRRTICARLWTLAFLIEKPETHDAQGHNELVPGPDSDGGVHRGPRRHEAAQKNGPAAAYHARQSRPSRDHQRSRQASSSEIP